jgi:hypothetical protein
VRWNLRPGAANRGIWKAGDLQRLPAEHRLVISTGKTSGLWPGRPASLKLEDLDVFRVVLARPVDDLLVPEPDNVARSGTELSTAVGATPSSAAAVVPRRRDGRPNHTRTCSR